MNVFKSFCITSMLFMSSHISAGITAVSTRFIYPSDAQSINIRLQNVLDKPALAQVWVDNGNEKVIPKAADNPFLLTPPISRIEPKTDQMIRVIFKPNFQLAQDRETLYWFNMFDIPAIAKEDQGKNLLNLSVRSRLKLFYRPVNLAMTQSQAFNALSFKVIGQSLEINNPSPYYLTFDGIHLSDSKSKNQSYSADFMIKPFSQKVIPNFKLNIQATDVDYELINDLGANQKFKAKVQ